MFEAVRSDAVRSLVVCLAFCLTFLGLAQAGTAQTEPAPPPAQAADDPGADESADGAEDGEETQEPQQEFGEVLVVTGSRTEG